MYIKNYRELTGYIFKV